MNRDHVPDNLPSSPTLDAAFELMSLRAQLEGTSWDDPDSPRDLVRRALTAALTSLQSRGFEPNPDLYSLHWYVSQDGWGWMTVDLSDGTFTTDSGVRGDLFPEKLVGAVCQSELVTCLPDGPSTVPAGRGAGRIFLMRKVQA